MIIIYHLEESGDDLRFIEYDRWDGKFLGRWKDQKMTEDEIIKRYNQGRWRTTSI